MVVQKMKMRQLSVAVTAILWSTQGHAAAISWTNPASGFWDIAGNWSSSPALPAAADTLTIDRPTTLTITHRSGTDAVTSITSQENLAITGGTLSVSGAYGNTANTSISFGRLNLNGASTLGSYTQTSGTLGGTGAVSVTGPTAISGGILTGAGNLQASGGLAITGGFGLDAGRTLTNRGTASWTAGSINLNADAFAGSGTLSNAVGANWEISGNNPSSIFASNNGAADNGSTAAVTNAGTLRKLDSTVNDVTTISTQFNNTGTVDVQSGILQLNGNSNLNGVTTIAAGAELRLNGGTHTLNNTSTTVNGFFGVNGGTVNLGAAQTITGTGSFVQSSGTVQGAALTVQSGATLSGGVQSGAATTTLRGTSEINGIFGLDAGRGLRNEAMLNWTGGSINLNGAAFAGSGSLTNAAGATLLIQGNNPSSIFATNNGAADSGTAAVLTNAGLIRKTGSVANDDTTISVRFNNTGTLDAASGRILLQGASTHTGATLSGAGILSFGGTATTTHSVDATSTITAANLEVSGGKTTVAGAVDVSGDTSINNGSLHLTGTLTSLGQNVSVNSSGLLDLTNKSAGIGFYTQNSGTLLNDGVLTIAGTGLFSGGAVSGAGTLLSAGTLTLRSTGFDGGQVLQNRDLVVWDSGSVDLNTSYFDVDSSQTRNRLGSARIQNDAGALFDASGFQIFSSNRTSSLNGDDGLSARIDNAGLFRKTGANATFIDVPLNNTGVLDATEGTLFLRSGGNQSGVLQVQAGGTLELNTGTFNLNGTANTINGVLRLASGVLNASTAQTLGGTGSFTQTGGSIRGANLTISSGANLSGGSQSGAATTTLKGATTVAGSLGLDAGRILRNEGTLTWTSGFFNLNDSGTAGAGSLVNATGATFLIQGDSASQVFSSNFGAADNGGTASFTNTGTLRKAGSTITDVTTISTLLTSTGTLDVQTGSLNLGGGSSLSGTVNVASGAKLGLTGGNHTLSGTTNTVNGELSLTTGTLNLGSAQTIGGTGQFSLSGGTVIGAALTVNGTFNQTSGAFRAGNLTVAGAASLSGGSQSGAATTTLKGASTLTGSLGLDAGRILRNEGTATWSSGFINLNDTGTAGTGGLVNATGATFLIQGDSASQIFASNNGAADNGGTASFSNAGTLRKLGSTTNDTATVSTAFTNTGAVDIQTGILQFSGNTTLGGTLSVANGAQMQLSTGTHAITGKLTVNSGGGLRLNGNGTYNVSGATNVLAGNLELAGGTLDLGAAQTIAATGSFTQTSGLLRGANLTVNGAAGLSGGSQSGAGTTTLKGTSSLTGSIGLDAGRILRNEGSATWSAGFINLNDNSTAGAGSLVNATGATFLIQGDGASQVLASNNGTADNGATASFSNAGTLRKTGSTTSDTATISTAFANSGTVDVQTGILSLSGGGTLGGTVNVANGAQLGLAGGAHNLGSTTTTVNGEFNFSTGSLNLTAAQTIGGTGQFNLSGGTVSGAALTVNGSYAQTSGAFRAGNLTVAGAASLSGGSQSGAATTTLKDASSLTGSIGLDAGRVLRNEGTATWSAGSINLNDNSITGSGSLVNATGATFLIQGESASQVFASNFSAVDNGSTASFSNAGTLRKLGSTTNDTATISTTFTNTGTIDVQTGILNLSGGSTLGGTVNVASGAKLGLTGGTHSLSGTTNTVNGELSLNTGTLNLTAAQTIGGTGQFNLSGGTVTGAALTVNGDYSQTGGAFRAGNLTVAGSASLSGGSQSGAATTTLKGASTITGAIGLDAGRILRNEGTATWSAGFINLNDNSTTGTGSLVNATGATFLIQGDSASQIFANNNGTTDNGSTASFTNAGTLRKLGSTTNDTTTISTAFTNTGSVDVQTGVLQFSGNTNLGGTLGVANGAEMLLSTGTHAIGGNLTVNQGGSLRMTGNGTYNVSGATNVLAGDLELAGGSLDWGTAQTVGATGSFSQTSGLLRGANLTVNGPASLSGGSQSGAGTTALKAASALTGSLGLDAGRILRNEGTATWSAGFINLNDNSTTGAGSLVNAVGATLLIQGDGASQIFASNNGAADNGGTASFSNAGTLRKLGSTTNDTVTISTLFTNTGALSVQTGILNLGGGGTLGGTVNVASGAALGLSGGAHNWSSTTNTVNGELNLSSGSLNLTAAKTVAGTGQFNLSGGTVTGAALTLNGAYTQTGGTFRAGNLIVAGAASLSGGSQSGAATTSLRGASAIAGSIGLDAGRVLRNEGAATWNAGFINLNDSSTAGAGSLVNAAGATLLIQGDGASQVFASNNGAGDTGGAASFSNAGTLRKLGSTTNDTATISTAFTNTGTVDVQTGILSLQGAITNQGTITLNGGQLNATGTFSEQGVLALQSGNAQVNSMTVSATGYLTAANNSRLVVQDDLTINSAANTSWNTLQGFLEFTSFGNHDLFLPGSNLGATASGYTNNFAWGGMELGTGAILNLKDGNATAGAGLYLGVLTLDGGLVQLGSIFSNFDIFYDASNVQNGYLGGATYALNGTGRLLPVASVASLFDGSANRAIAPQLLAARITTLEAPAAAVPIPASLPLMVSGALPLLAAGRRRKASIPLT